MATGPGGCGAHHFLRARGELSPAARTLPDGTCTHAQRGPGCPGNPLPPMVADVGPPTWCPSPGQTLGPATQRQHRAPFSPCPLHLGLHTAAPGCMPLGAVAGPLPTQVLSVLCAQWGSSPGLVSLPQLASGELPFLLLGERVGHPTGEAGWWRWHTGGASHGCGPGE